MGGYQCPDSQFLSFLQNSQAFLGTDMPGSQDSIGIGNQFQDIHQFRDHTAFFIQTGYPSRSSQQFPFIPGRNRGQPDEFAADLEHGFYCFRIEPPIHSFKAMPPKVFSSG